MSGIGATQLDDQNAELRNNFREVQVKTISLNDLLDSYKAPPVIDFMSIDTEGSETRILNAFDFSKRRVRAFAVEHNFVQRDDITAIMQANGYTRLFPEISGHDDWWILSDELPGLGAVTSKVADRTAEVFDRDLNRRRTELAEHFRTQQA